MSGVSNFLARRNDGRDLEVRPVRRDEIEPALRLVLAGSPAPDGHDDAVAEFLRHAAWRGIDLTGIWVAADPAAERIVWAVLPIVTPGRGMILMVPPRLRPGLYPRHVAELVASATLEPRRQEVNLVQVLIDPDHSAVVRAMLDSGFERIAELSYLARHVHEAIPGRHLPESRFRLWRYDRSRHHAFAQAIERSYEGRLDCPKLNGRRHIEDIIESHKSAGEFDPGLWHLLTDVGDRPLGVMLLNRLPRREGYELVYVGLVPEARGHGLGNGLVRLAINALAAEGGGVIVTAVDADNAPARRLYHRHGFGHLYARLALAKTMSPATEQTARLVATSRQLLARLPPPEESPLA